MTNRTWMGLVLALVLGACGSSSSGSGHGAGASSSGSGGGNGGGNGGGLDGSASSSSGGADGSAPGTDGSTPKPGTDGSAPGIVGSTNVQIIVEPEGNSESDIAAAIKSAKKSVHMTMYLLDNTAVVQALIDQHNAGLDVKVVLNQVFPSGTTSSNPQTYTTLSNAGVGIVWANSTRFTYTHEKTFILDGTTSWIMNMNLDQTSSQDNREYLVADNETADATEAEQIFAADYANQVVTASGSLVVAPQPPNNARIALTTLIASATTALDIEAEEFSDFGSSGSGVTQAVVAAAQRGVKVRLVLAQGTPTSSQTEAIGDVKTAGGSVVVSGGTSGGGSASNPYIHAKAIVVDCAGSACASGYIGSENFSGGSLGYNRELGVLVTNGTELGKVESTISADFAKGTPQ